MARFKPTTPFNVPMKVLIPTYSTVKGTRQQSFADPVTLSDDYLFYGSFRSFVGSITTENDLSVTLNTAYVETWYRPDIKSNCRIYLCDSGDVYEVVGDPENIELRHQYLKIRVQKIGGAA